MIVISASDLFPHMFTIVIMACWSLHHIAVLEWMMRNSGRLEVHVEWCVQDPAGSNLREKKEISGDIYAVRQQSR